MFGNAYNMEDLLKTYMGELKAENDREASRQYSRFLSRQKKLTLLFTPVNVALSLAPASPHLRLPEILAPAAQAVPNFLFNAVQQPFRIGSEVPSREDYQEAFAQYALMKEIENNEIAQESKKHTAEDTAWQNAIWAKEASGVYDQQATDRWFAFDKTERQKRTNEAKKPTEAFVNEDDMTKLNTILVATIHKKCGALLTLKSPY